MFKCYSLAPGVQGEPGEETCSRVSPWLFWFFVFLFWPLPGTLAFPSQRSHLSCSCNLSRRCGNAGSLTHCAGPREPRWAASQHSPGANNPVAPQQDLLRPGFKPAAWGGAGVWSLHGGPAHTATCKVLEKRGLCVSQHQQGERPPSPGSPPWQHQQLARLSVN